MCIVRYLQLRIFKMCVISLAGIGTSELLLIIPLVALLKVKLLTYFKGDHASGEYECRNKRNKQMVQVLSYILSYLMWYLFSI